MNIAAIGVEVILIVCLFSILGIDLIIPKDGSRRQLAYLSVGGFSAAFAYSFWAYHDGASPTLLQGLFILDNYSLFFKQLFIAGMIFTILFSLDYVEEYIQHKGEFYALLFSATCGMCVMASANDLLTAFVGLELMTISFYVLVGLEMKNKLSGEAAVKYLIIGAASTAIMLYGISLVYGSTGSLIFREIKNQIHLFYAVGIAGVTMVIIGYFFKLSVIPFHMWTPDVYQGAPLPVTALLAMGSKAAGLSVFMRVLYVAFPVLGNYWLPILAFFSALCMIGGNIMAIRQKDVKRMLAYSSIAQAGYMMAGIVAADTSGMKAVMFYATLYMFANIGAFAVLAFVKLRRDGTDREAITGLAQASPLMAVVMTVSLLSMAGIPPTAGFSGKIYLFSAVVDRGYMWLAVTGFVMSMISVYYYLMVVKAMYRDLSASEADKATEMPVPTMLNAIAFVAFVATLSIGICPEGLSIITNIASASFMK